MHLIRAALRRPGTVLVLVASILGAALLAILRMPIDVFPRLDLPIIYVAQPYGGMSPAEMEGYIVNYYEANFLYISGVDHIESRSIQNVGLLKLTFLPGTDMSRAAAETTAYIERALAYMPAGMVPPFIMRYDAGSVPVGDVILSSPIRSQAELDDFAQVRIRPMFSGLAGVSAPSPFGGNPRSILINLNEDALTARHLGPDDVVRALTQGNIVLPSGNVRMGDLNRIVHVNTVVPAYQELLNLPLRSGAGPTVLLRDVATIADAADVASGYAELNGRRVVYIPVTKHADASTLQVVGEVKAALPLMSEQVPPDVRVDFAFDQSVYVRNTLEVLLFESCLGAMLTGLVVWLFLRDPRSSLIVILVIPFALLAATAGLWAAGQSLNIMTLGGLALAVGILVDEATVAVENIHAHLARGRPVARAVRDSAGEVFVPRLLAMLSVVAVLLPSFFMVGVSRSLFIPLSLAVALAMVSSFLLSSTFVPVLAVLLLRGRRRAGGRDREPARPPDAGFERWKTALSVLVARLLRKRTLALAIYFGASFLLIAILVRADGTDVFPFTDTGQFQLRLRARAGTRFERTETLFNRARALVEREAGPGNVENTLGFVGAQPRAYPVNNIYLWTSGEFEAVMQVALRRGSGIHLADFEERLRGAFARELPQVAISFEAGDIIGQIMNLGSPTPLAVQVTGFDSAADHAYAERVRGALASIPELRDLQYGQPYQIPAVLVTVDRQRAAQLGLTLASVGRSLTEVTASSRFVARDFWQNPQTGVTYQVQLMLPPAEVGLDALRSLPLAPAVTGPPLERTAPDPAGKPILLGDVAQTDLGFVPGEYDHYNMQRMISLTANFYRSNLGDAAADVQRALRRLPAPPRGTRVALIGQVQPMNQTLAGLRIGLLLALLVILLLLTASFQSWRLALTVLSAIPALLVGALTALKLCGTTLNIESFMGIIMAVGISVANGILLVTFAEGRRKAIHRDLVAADDAPAGEWVRRARAASAAAIEGSRLRFRPILMTAGAMIAGMIPMALSLESGGEQSAPLGQAVIGGLLGATGATLLLAPLVFSWIQRRQGSISISLDPDDPASAVGEGSVAGL